MRLLALFVATFVFASSAVAAGDCFYRRTASSYQVTGIDQFDVREGGRTYRVRTNFCPRLRWADRIGFDSWSSWVCSGDYVLLFDWQGRYEDRCFIMDVTRL